MFSIDRTLRPALCAAAIFLASALQLPAQVVATAPPPSVNLADYNNRWDAFVGYSYARFNTTVGHQLTGNLMGWKAQATGWISPIVGVSASTGNYYGSVPVPTNAYNITSPAISEHFFLFGPEVRLLRNPKYTVDYHFLLGGTYGVFDSSTRSANIEPNQIGLYNNQLAFALATGTNLDYNLSPKLSIRGIIDFQPTHYGLAFQKDVSASAGVVYKWGAIKK